jgi:hypothetical protein
MSSRIFTLPLILAMPRIQDVAAQNRAAQIDHRFHPRRP